MVDRTLAATLPLAERFELRAKIGEGGMGVVYRALDRALGKEVALKRVRYQPDLGGSRLLKSEFRIRSALQHRNLVHLYELLVDEDDCLLTMELVEGTDLGSWVRGAEVEGESPITARTVAEGAAGRGASSPPPVAPQDGPRSSSGSRAASKGAIEASDVPRLRSALVELCQGLAALHDAGIVHRDVTPANVRVTPAGRVVLLDFGLAARPTPEPQGAPIVIVGTPRYMAPEQVRAEATTAAVDVYAVGGILYELLAGRSAFDGSPRSMQVAKAAGVRPTPIAPGGVDDALARLALAMLDPDPALRPDVRAVARALSGTSAAPSIAPPAPSAGAGVFVGREREVDALRGALARVQAGGRPLAVVVEGESGIGKTTLLDRAIPLLHAALALTARCHPQEAIPFKALDAAMDTLAQHAAARVDLGLFPPSRARAAVRIFPALAAVWMLGAAPADEVRPDDVEERALAFAALRELLCRCAARGPIVLWIDDVQWDDDDSSLLLEALLRGDDAPPILLVASLRASRPASPSAIVRRLFEARPVVPVERWTLGPLDDADVARIAAESFGPGDPRVARVVSGSAGNPFLASELARYLAKGRSTDAAREEVPAVVDLVEARLRHLDPAERALLVTVSLAARPLTVPCALAAVGLAADARTRILTLRDARLVRIERSPRGETVTPYHDKIAEAAPHLVTREGLLDAHRAIALALARFEPDDADALCVHWEGAGEGTRAASAAWVAAGRAAASLAFGRAAALYEKAIALGFDGVDPGTLFDRAAAAHAEHGHASDAARRYLDAARANGGDVKDERVRASLRKAAEQYVKSGYVRDGWRVMRSVLDAAGIPHPRSPRAATLGALGRRLRFLTRRIDPDAIGDRVIPERERARLEILWTASTSMSMVDVGLSDAFRTQHLSTVLDVGDRSSVARALAYEAALEVHVGGPFFDWHAGRLLDAARRLVDRTGDPYDRAWLALGVANRAFCSGRFQDAITACKESSRVLREQCRGVAWELTTVAAFLLTSLAMRGDLLELREVAERFVSEAEERSDLFGVAEGYGGECVLGFWSMGRGEEALARARVAVARQGGDAEAWPEKTYRRGELTEVMGTIHLRLLAAEPWPAWRMIREHWSGLESAMIPSLQFYRSWVRHGRARAALAAAVVGAVDDEARDGWTRARLLDDARKMHRALAKETRPFGAPWGALVEAGLAHAEGDRRRAIDALGRAVTGFDRAGMALYREAARYRQGDLEGARGRRDEAEAWLRAQGVPDAGALAFALAPGTG